MKTKKFERSPRNVKNEANKQDAKDSKKILWNQLQTLLAGDVQGVNWLLQEIGEFLEKESTRLLQSSKQ